MVRFTHLTLSCKEPIVEAYTVKLDLLATESQVLHGLLLLFTQN